VYWDSKPFIDFRKGCYGSVKAEVLYNILTEFGILMKLIKNVFKQTLYQSPYRWCKFDVNNVLKDVIWVIFLLLFCIGVKLSFI
jgi:hypothetical protein